MYTFFFQKEGPRHPSYCQRDLGIDAFSMLRLLHAIKKLHGTGQLNYIQTQPGGMASLAGSGNNTSMLIAIKSHV